MAVADVKTNSASGDADEAAWWELGAGERRRSEDDFEIKG